MKNIMNEKSKIKFREKGNLFFGSLSEEIKILNLKEDEITIETKKDVKNFKLKDIVIDKSFSDYVIWESKDEAAEFYEFLGRETDGSESYRMYNTASKIRSGDNFVDLYED